MAGDFISVLFASMDYFSLKFEMQRLASFRYFHNDMYSNFLHQHSAGHLISHWGAPKPSYPPTHTNLDKERLNQTVSILNLGMNSMAAFLTEDKPLRTTNIFCHRYSLMTNLSANLIPETELIVQVEPGKTILIGKALLLHWCFRMERIFSIQLPSLTSSNPWFRYVHLPFHLQLSICQPAAPEKALLPIKLEAQVQGMNIPLTWATPLLRE